jgi:peptidoglycan/xylan/chitin deacetylase (PgdA/CDA1 family)
VITVDDGLADVVRHASPVLRRHGATATFYVSALPYVEQRVLMVQKIQLLHAKLGLERFRAAFGEELARQRSGGFEPDAMDYARGVRFYPYDDEAVRAFKLDLNYRIPYEVVEPVLERLFLGTFGLASEKEAVPHLYLALDDLSRLVDEGFEIGIHGYDHHVLPRLDYLQQRRNLESTVDWLAPITGRRDLTVSYPHGFSNVHTKRAMKELGLAAGFALGRRMVQPRDLEARWQIPRFDVNDCFDRDKNQIRYEVFSALSTGD